MTKKWSFKNLFNFGKKSVPKVDKIIESKRGGIHKAYIPKFLYKPAFGYPRYTDITTIRRLAATPFVSMCIDAIIDEIGAVEWDIVPKEEEGTVEDLKEEIDHVRTFLYNPNSKKENFEIILKKLSRDILEVDTGVLEKSFNQKQELVEIYARDGATFTINPDIHGTFDSREDFILGDYIAYQKELQKQGVENSNIEPNWITAQEARDKAAYFQYGWVTGARPVPFGKREIVWVSKNPRTDTLYGRSPVEVLNDVIQTLIYSIENNLDYFEDNSIPKGIIGLEGADTDEIKSFKENWKEVQKQQNEVGDWKKKFYSVPIIGGKSPKFERIQFSNAELELIEQQKWFSKIVWACYDDQTEILTEDGFKLFKDLKNEKVARVNPEGLQIDYIKPVDKQEYDFNGELINYKTKSCDLAVTPEHKMLQCEDNKFYSGDYDWKEKEAKDFNRGIIPQAGNFKGEEIEEMNFKSENKYISNEHKDTKEFKISGDNFCKFMGIWLSDGWVESSNNRIVLCASDVYPENKEFIEKLLKDMEVDYNQKISKTNGIIQGKKVNINGDMNYYRFSNKAFADYLKQFGKAKEKYIPKEIKNATKEQRELFLEAFMIGDGSEGYKGRNDRYGSMSKKLADDLQEILVTSGKSATVTQNSHNDCWEVTIRKTKTDKIENKYYSRIIKDSVTKKEYNGKVYDVTVPEHHYLVVRRNGRVSISGNCFGVTPSELGFTGDSKNVTEIVQSKVFRRRALNPILRLLEYKINSDIISEFEYEGIEFKFNMFDVEEEKKKYELFDLQVKSGILTINEIRKKEGLEEVEWGDKPPREWQSSENSFNFGFGGGSAGPEQEESPFMIGDGDELEENREDRFEEIGEKSVEKKHPKGDKNHFYHMTKPEHIEKIKKAGLKQSKEGYAGEAVYFGEKPKDTLGYEYNDYDEGVMIRVNREEMYQKFGKYSKENQSGNVEYSPDDPEGEVLITENVPAKYLQYWDGNDWKSIQDYNPKEQKSIENNPLVLGENETPDDATLEQGMLYLIKKYQKKIKDLIEREHGENKINEVKDLSGLAKKLKEILSFQGLKNVTNEVIKAQFLKGWTKGEKQVDRNFVPNKEAIKFIQSYTFDNIKEMGDETANDLRQEIERAIMNGEGITSLKKRIEKVMKVTKNRAEKIARTEVNRAENIGQLQAMENVKDEYNKKWVAQLDDRTSEVCKKLDGQIVGIDENFKADDWEGKNPPAHVNCFDKKTEVYTNKGWKYFKDLDGEKIWSLNPETLEPEWVNYKEFIKQKSDKIVYYKSNNCDLAVTPDHNQFVNFRKKQKGRSDAGEWKLVKDKDLPNYDFSFYKGVNWNKKSPEKVKIGNKEFNYKAFARFIGWFLSEGSYTEGKNCIKISQEKEENIPILSEDMIKLDCRVEKWTGGVYIFDKDLIEYVKQFGKAKEKYIPKEIKEASSEVIKEFLNTFCLGDGSIRKGKYWKGYQFQDSRVFFTSSEIMAAELGELIMKIGKSVSYSLDKCKGKKVKFKNGEYTINHNVWRIYELNNTTITREYLVKEEKDYNDYVYDVELEKNHILLTRRNGKVLWSGNCRSTMVFIPKE